MAQGKLQTIEGQQTLGWSPANHSGLGLQSEAGWGRQRWRNDSNQKCWFAPQSFLSQQIKDLHKEIILDVTQEKFCPHTGNEVADTEDKGKLAIPSKSFWRPSALQPLNRCSSTADPARRLPHNDPSLAVAAKLEEQGLLWWSSG